MSKRASRHASLLVGCIIHAATPALLLLVLGCGPKQPVDENRTTVSGVVTFDGKPLPAGTIIFASVDSPIASTFSIGEGGRYGSSRVPIGENLVTIETESLQFGSPQLYVRIPARYSDPTQSGLKVEVKPGVNENVDFELKP